LRLIPDDALLISDRECLALRDSAQWRLKSSRLTSKVEVTCRRKTGDRKRNDGGEDSEVETEMMTATLSVQSPLYLTASTSHSVVPGQPLTHVAATTTDDDVDEMATVGRDVAALDPNDCQRRLT